MRAYGLAKNIVLTSLILLLSLVPLGTNVVCAIPSYMAARYIFVTWRPPSRQRIELGSRARWCP